MFNFIFYGLSEMLEIHTWVSKRMVRTQRMIRHQTYIPLIMPRFTRSSCVGRRDMKLSSLALMPTMLRPLSMLTPKLPSSDDWLLVIPENPQAVRNISHTKPKSTKTFTNNNQYNNTIQNKPMYEWVETYVCAHTCVCIRHTTLWSCQP